MVPRLRQLSRLGGCTTQKSGWGMVIFCLNIAPCSNSLHSGGNYVSRGTHVTSAMVCILLQLLVELKTIDGCSIALQKKMSWLYGADIDNLGSTIYNSWVVRWLSISGQVQAENQEHSMQGALFFSWSDHWESPFSIILFHVHYIVPHILVLFLKWSIGCLVILISYLFWQVSQFMAKLLWSNWCFWVA